LIPTSTVLGCITWEDIEPVEDQFHFVELDKVILGARNYVLQIASLWLDPFQVPRPMPCQGQGHHKMTPTSINVTSLRGAGNSDALSIFHEEDLKAEANVYGCLPSHPREGGSVIQIKNETGLLGDSRYGSAAAAAFQRTFSTSWHNIGIISTKN
jgi:hypothetical protein